MIKDEAFVSQLSHLTDEINLLDKIFLMTFSRTLAKHVFMKAWRQLKDANVKIWGGMELLMMFLRSLYVLTDRDL